MRAGTDPALADSDGDGLGDGDEEPGCAGCASAGGPGSAFIGTLWPLLVLGWGRRRAD